VLCSRAGDAGEGADAGIAGRRQILTRQRVSPEVCPAVRPKDERVDGWQDALKQARRERKWSRREAAAAAGLGEATIEAWETGRRHPRMENLIAYCRTLGVSAPERQRIVADAGYGEEPRDDSAERP